MKKTNLSSEISHLSSPISAWLFDVYPSERGVTLWFIGQNGARLRCFRTFTPSFFLHLNNSDAKRAEVLADRCPVPVSLVATTRTEIYSGDSIDVLQVFVKDPMRFREVVWYFEKFFPHFAFFNSDVSVEQQFLYETQLFLLHSATMRLVAKANFFRGISMTTVKRRNMNCRRFPLCSFATATISCRRSTRSFCN